jgi:short subunit dehydrogenase-like uncharacterized protein
MRRLIVPLVLIAVLGGLWLSLPDPAKTPAKPPPPLAQEVLDSLPADRSGQVLIYGAYGFTGSGIARLAAEYGIRPVLAGRNEAKLTPLADSLNLDYVVLTLENNHDNLVAVLEHFELVLHIAGPYTYTARPMLDAVVAAGTHYVDLTGENHVIQAQLDRDDEFREANIMVMPAVGFDVVPTDCLNVYVADRVENANLLTVVIESNANAIAGAGASRGTAKSGLEILARPLLLRQNGAMVQADKPKVIERSVEGRAQTLVQIPWADLMTSWVSTGIPTIEVFQVQQGELPGWVLTLARSEAGRRALAWAIDSFMPEGPSDEAQAKSQTVIEATASNAAGDTASARLLTPEPYKLTFHSTLLIARRILDGQWDPGFQTPGKVYGPDLVLEIPGVSRVDL